MAHGAAEGNRDQDRAWLNRRAAPGGRGDRGRPLERRTLEAALVVTRLAGTWKLHPTVFHLKDVPYHPLTQGGASRPFEPEPAPHAQPGGNPGPGSRRSFRACLVESPGLDQEAAATAASSLSAGPWRRRGMFRPGWL